MDQTTAKPSWHLSQPCSRPDKERYLESRFPEELLYDFIVTPSLLAHRSRKGKARMCPPLPLSITTTTRSSLFPESEETIRHPCPQLNTLLAQDIASSSSSVSSSRPGSWLSLNSLSSASTAATSLGSWTEEKPQRRLSAQFAVRPPARRRRTSTNNLPGVLAPIPLEDSPLHFPMSSATSCPIVATPQEPLTSHALVKGAKRFIELARAFQDTYLHAVVLSVIPSPLSPGSRLRPQGQRALVQDVRHVFSFTTSASDEDVFISLARLPRPSPQLVFKPQTQPTPSPMRRRRSETAPTLHPSVRLRNVPNPQCLRVKAICNIIGVDETITERKLGLAFEDIGHSRLRYPVSVDPVPLAVVVPREIVRGRSRVARSPPHPSHAIKTSSAPIQRRTQCRLRDINLFPPTAQGSGFPRRLAAVC